jgi:hypothetical protein
MLAHPFNSHTSRARRIITGLALLAYVLSVVGYPVPLPAAAPQDTSTPFPCQGHACGCHSAAQCYDNCCCYSPAQRLAWARKNGVTLPPATAAALASKAAEEAERTSGSCCHRAGGCCDEPSAAAQTAGGFVWVHAIQAQKCQGLSTLWITSGANLPLVIRPLWEFQWVPAGETLLTDDAALVVSAQPDVPPPRS